MKDSNDRRHEDTYDDPSRRDDGPPNRPTGTVEETADGTTSVGANSATAHRGSSVEGNAHDRRMGAGAETSGEAVGRDTAGASNAPGEVMSGDVPGLFPSDERERFHGRWRDIQTNFVDDPRRAVEDADTLVGEVTDRLVSVFTRNRDELERQWTAGEDVSTEDLRRTLRQYRAFFERLLGV